MAKKKIIPVMPFNTGEWLQHPVKDLPLDVKGLWMDLLCYMWESAERGVMVKPNLEIYTRQEIIHMVGLDSSGSDAWLDMLVNSGLCSIRDDGAYFSRQILRGEAIRAKRREAGKKGGCVTKEKVFSRLTVQQPVSTPVTAVDRPKQIDLFPPDESTPPPPTPKQQAKIDKAKKYKYAEFVTLTRDEYTNLCVAHGEKAAKRMIEILDNYKGSKGKKYKSDYRTILNWVVDRYNEEYLKNGKINDGVDEPPKKSGEPDYYDTL